MTSTLLTVFAMVRAIVELAGLLLLAQAVLYLLAGPRRVDNAIYQLFQILTQPVLGSLRTVLPREIGDRHVPIIAFMLLLWLWIMLAYIRLQLLQPG